MQVIFFWGAALNFILNIVFNVVFIHFWGVPGIALSTTAVFIFSFGFLFLMLRYYLIKLSAPADQGHQP